MKISLIVITCLIYSLPLSAQVPDTVWTKTFGGLFESEGTAVTQHHSGDILIGGMFDYKPCLIRIDNDGNEIWTKIFEIDSMYHTHTSALSEIYEVEEDNYVMGCGSICSGLMWYNRTTDSTFIKYYSCSDMHTSISPRAIKKVKDEGYLVMWVWRVTNAFGHSGTSTLLKVDLAGDEQWRKSSEEYITGMLFPDVKPTKDGGIIVIGDSPYFRPTYVIKTNEIGEIIWNKNFFDTNKYIWGRCILETKDNGFIFLTNNTDSNTNITDSNSVSNYLIKIDVNGDSLWSKYLGFSGKEHLDKMKSTSDGGYILIGSTDEPLNYSADILIVKVDSLGNQQWSKTIVGDNMGYALDVCETHDGYIIVGTTSDHKILVVKLKSSIVGVNKEYIEKLPSRFYLAHNYPNPFNPSTAIEYSIPKHSYVTLKVFDVLGREVKTLVNKEQPQGNYEVEFDASNLTSGVYFYRIQAGNFVETKKMILLR